MGKDYLMSDCRALGLEGLPVVVEANKTDGRYGLESLSMLVRDADGDVIVGDKSMFVAKRLLAEEYDDSVFEVVAFIVDTGYQRFLRDSLTLDEFDSLLGKSTSNNLQYGLACISGPGLTIPQREAAAAIVRIAKNYLPPIEREDEYIFPATLDDFAKEDDALSRRCLPWKTFTESKAYEVAEIISRLYDVEAKVFLGGDEYYVSATHSAKLAANINRITAQMELLQTFDLRTSKITTQSLKSVEQGEMEAVEERAAQAFRIEDGINAILAHLGHPEASGRKSAASAPRKTATATKGRGIDALIPPAPKPAGKKSSAKQSA